MITSTRSWRPSLLLITFALFVAAGPAYGQGTSGSLPDPIAGSDVTTYGRVLDLSEDQRLAVDSFHEQYLRDFGTLRNTEIQRYLDESGNLMRMLFPTPDADAIKKQLDALDRVMGRIRSLDERLFDQMQTVLSESQIERMPRVRQMRSRERYRSGLARIFSFSNPGSRVDLSRLLSELDLSPSEEEAVTPMLGEYERQLTVRLHALYEGTQDMYKNLADRSDELAAAVQGPGGDLNARRRPAFERMRDIMTEAGKEARDAASEVSQLNVRFFKTFRDLLEESTVRALMTGYFERAYRDVYNGMMEVIARYDEALRLPGLADDQHRAIEVARDDLRRRHESLAWQMIDLTEKVRRESGMFRFGDSGDTPEEERLDRLSEQRDEMNEKALAALETMLGKTLAAKLDAQRDGARDVSRRSEAVAVMIASNGSDGQVMVSGDVSTVTLSEEGPSDPYLPGPIGASELDLYAAILRLSPDARMVLESVHGMYLDRWEDIRTEHLEPIEEAQRGLWSFDRASGEMSAPTPEDVDHVYELRANALDAILASDRTFFDDVELAVLTSDEQSARLPRARRARERVVYNRSSEGGAGPGRFFARFGNSPGEATIDLTRLLAEFDLPTPTLDELERVTADYEKQLTEALRRRYRLLVDERKATDRMSRQMAGGNDDDGGRRRRFRMAFESEAWQAREQLRGQRRDLEETIAALNRDALDAVRPLLPGGVAGELQRTYNRHAYPQVYDDDGAVHGSLREALELEDLSDRQRAEIASALAEYRGDYEALCEKMIEHEQSRGEAEDRRDPEFWRQRQEIRNARDRVRFDRTELNDRTRRRLRSILTDAQAQEIGLVDEVAE